MKTYAPASPGGKAPGGSASSSSSSSAPAMAADAEWFSVEELETARENYLMEQEKEQPSPQVKLRYAIALAKSKKRDDKYRGIGLLEDLLEQEHDQKECLYWIALTYYGLGEYRASRSHCERLIRMDPNHTKALALHDCIKEVIASDGILGVGLVGAVVVAGIALKLLLKR
uniref:Mitochondrial fission 1 protein n=1 Tax=Globisporangium ultimum (strain ATCC 200006 / CBS 805.95 / DAOM BR144) TaxID=431595 RepID=K3W6M2_GLOUD